MIAWYLRGRARRRLVNDARLLIREAGRILGRHQHRVQPEVAREVRASIEELQQELRAGADDAVGAATQSLDDKVARYLSFGRKSRPREYVESVGVAVGLALLLRAFVVEAFKIPSGSMLPTLEVGDHLFVNKYLYGLRVPWTNLKFLELREPRRGEVIVFVYPVEKDKDFIKRIVGVGGDTVEVRSRRLFVNGQPVPRRPIPGPCLYRDVQEGTSIWKERRCEQFFEELGGFRYRTIYDPGGGYRQNFPPTHVPENTVFVMGDNRDNSHDSRFWGTVPTDHIKGKALFIWLSWGGPSTVRWNRFFQPVHRDD